MTKFFIFGAPGSGILRAAEELYSREDFKKIFKKDPLYKRQEFPKDIKWVDLKSVIDENYSQEQEGTYEVHGGWWIYKYFEKIKENYPGSYFVVVSRYSRESLQRIGVNGSAALAINLQGGEEVWAEKIKLMDETLHQIVENNNATWVNLFSDGKAFNEDFSIIESTDEPKKATVKMAIGKL